MGTVTIKSGETGKIAAVDSRNRLASIATAQSGFFSAAVRGGAFNATTSVVNLTSDNESAIFYLDSAEESDVVLETITVNIGQSNVEGDVIRRDIIAPTGGTLIDNAVDAFVANLNTGSAKQFNGNIYRGVEGDTVTGGSFSDTTIHHQSFTETSQSGLILTQGSRLGLTITPPPGNTSLNVQIIIVFYLLSEV